MPTQLGPRILHSLYGSKLGVNRDGTEVSAGNTYQIHSTSAADLTLTVPYISVLSSNSATFVLPAPGPDRVGVSKVIFASLTSSSTLQRAILSSACTFQTTGGSSFTSNSLYGPGQYISFRAISSGVWMHTGTNSSGVYTTTT